MFSVATKSRVYHFVANTESERSEWVSALTTNILATPTTKCLFDINHTHKDLELVFKRVNGRVER
jgi:hypothetical protein